MATLVYKYGLGSPTTPEVVEEQLYLRHKYRNKLIEIERERRARYREIMERHQLPILDKTRAYEEARDRLEARLDELKKLRAKTRTRVNTKEQREEIKVLRGEKKQRSAELKAARESLKKSTETQRALEKLQEDILKQQKAARANRGNLYWGSSCAEEEALRVSSEKLKIWSKKGEPLDPPFLRWKGGTALSVQIQKSKQVPFEELLKCQHQQLQLEMEPRPDPKKTSKTRAKRRRGVMRIRAGSVVKPDGTRSNAPVWAEFPILMHRDPPEGAVVTNVQVNRRTIADGVRWNVDFTLTTGAASAETCGEGAVAVDIGWRDFSDLRVAYARDDQGVEKEFRLPERFRSRMMKVESLQSIRSTNQNVMQDALIPWLKRQKSKMPEELVTRTQNISRWRSPGAFMRLLQVWSENRWHGDERGFQILETWAIGVWSPSLNRRDGGDRHLWRWMEYQRTRTLRYRKDLYRKYAAEMARTYRELVLEKFDLRETQKDPEPESTKVKVPKAAKQQVDTAPSELRDCLVQAFLSRGGEVHYIDPALTTQRCHLCGYAEPWDASKSVTHECEGCHAVWDQDANAAKNLLEAYGNGEIVESKRPSTAPAPKGGAWKKRKDKKSK